MDWIKSGKVREIKEAQNAAYILEESRIFSLTGFKVLQNQEKEDLVKCMKVSHNGKIKLVYLTSGLKSFASMLPKMDGDTFISILAGLLSGIVKIKNNGFLQCENIHIAYDKIFINPATLKVHLIYLPLEIESGEQNRDAFENDLRTNLIQTIHATALIHSEETQKIAGELAKASLTLEQLCNLVVKEAKRWEPTVEKSFFLKKKNHQEPLSLVSVNMPMQVVFEINKQEYVIGKNAELADGAITYNNAISRRHCKIIYEDHNYYVCDLESANGTFLNEKKLVSGTHTPIKKGDKIRVANIEFLVS